MIVEPLVQGAAGMRVQPARLPARGARAVRPPRRAADLRRGRDRLRAHGDDVRLRAGAGRARLPLPRQGADRRLPAARRDADDRAGLRGVPRRARGAPHLLPRPHLHRQPARLRGRARQPRRLRAGAARCCGCSRRSGCCASCSATSPAMPEVAEVRGRGFMVGIDLGEHDPALRLGHRVALEARERGAIIRPLGDVVVLMPPLAISKADLRRLVAITAASIRAAHDSAVRRRPRRARRSSPPRPPGPPSAGAWNARGAVLGVMRPCGSAP